MVLFQALYDENDHWFCHIMNELLYDYDDDYVEPANDCEIPNTNLSMDEIYDILISLDNSIIIEKRGVGNLWVEEEQIFNVRP